MPCGPISYDNIASVTKTHGLSKPIFMLNLGRYRSTAQYLPQYSHLAGDECTGVEAMARYRTALTPLLPLGAAIHFAGKVLTGVVVPDSEKWDYVHIVQYETLEGFKGMVESEVYKRDAEGHRLAGLEDFRLVMLEGMEAS